MIFTSSTSGVMTALGPDYERIPILDRLNVLDKTGTNCVIIRPTLLPE